MIDVDTMASEHPRIRLGSIGLGWWGGVLAKAAAASGMAEVVGCYARTAATREQFAVEHGCVAHVSLQALLASDIDAVVIATPHTTHADLAVEAARAGKHVFVDKPLTLTLPDADRVIEMIEGHGLVLQVGHNRRRQPATRQMKKWLDEGALGHLLHVSAVHHAPLLFNPNLSAWRRMASENPAGGLTALGIHQVDTFNYLAGRINAVTASSKHVLGGGEVDDITSILLEFDSGVLGQISTSPAAGPAVEVTLSATEAIVRSSNDGAELTIQARPGEKRELVTLVPLDTTVDQMAEFVSSIRGDTRPETGAVAARHAVAVLEAIVESTRSRRWVDVDR